MSRTKYYPIEPPIPDREVEDWKFFYLRACPTPRDPTIVWGTDVDCSQTQAWLRRVNAESPVLVTPAHVLLRATAEAVARHPEFNSRVLRKRIHRYRELNMTMPIQKKDPPATDLMYFAHADRKSVLDFAREMWEHNRDAARGEFYADRQRLAYRHLPLWLIKYAFYPLHLFLINNFNLKAYDRNLRQRTASTMVNYLGFKGAAPLRSFKPSRFPYDSVTLTVTMGAIEPRPTAVNGEAVVRPVAPLFIRADHRIVDAHEIGTFATTLRNLIADPALLDPQPTPAEPAARGADF